jgi:YHS domain-containing protein
LIIKFILFFALGYFGYKVFKSMTHPQRAHPSKAAGYADEAPQIDDVMVQDPVCRVYFPKKDGHHLHTDGKDLYFCSRACRDKYLGTKTEKPG